MRKNATDCYERIALIGKNIYDINFMHYLITSQNISSVYNSKYAVNDSIKLRNLKKIAYYFGTREPFLINDDGLRNIFNNNGMLQTIDFLKLSSEDIIDQIDMCLESDAVYVCNSDKILDKSTMFILGYLMAMEQEIFFWNEIDKSEWLMSCILKKTLADSGYKEIIMFPLEFIRSLAYPYLFKDIKTNINPGKYRGLVINENGNYGVDRNTEFTLPINNNLAKKSNTVCLLGSLTKQLDTIKKYAKYFQSFGYKILAPQISNVRSNINGFMLFEDDKSNNPITIETDFLEKCITAEKLVVCDKNGYIGNTVMFEIGYLAGKNRYIEFIEPPKDEWLLDTINFYLKKENIKTLSKK